MEEKKMRWDKMKLLNKIINHHNILEMVSHLLISQEYGKYL